MWWIDLVYFLIRNCVGPSETVKFSPSTEADSLKEAECSKRSILNKFLEKGSR